MYVYVYGSSCSTGRKFIKFDLVSHTLISFNNSTKHQPTSTNQPCLTRVHWSPLEGGTCRWFQLSSSSLWGIPDLELTRASPIPPVGHLRLCGVSWSVSTVDRTTTTYRSFRKIVEGETYGSLKIIGFLSILRLLKLVMFFVCSSHVGLFFWFRLRTLRSWPLKLFDIRHIFYQPIQKHIGSVEDYFKKFLQLFLGVSLIIETPAAVKSRAFDNGDMFL